VVVLGLAGYGAGWATQIARRSGRDHHVGQNLGDRTALPPGPTDRQSQDGDKAASQNHRESASRSQGVYSTVQGQSAIVFIVPDGFVVKKGDRICELDSSALRDQLINQRITSESAKANYGNAKLASESAQLDLKAYRDDLFPLERREFEGDTKIAEAELALA